MTRFNTLLLVGGASLLLAFPTALGAAPARIVLFEVGATNVNDRWSYFLDPILLMEGRRHLQPPSTLTRNEPARAYAQFARAYYREGQTYGLLYAGRRAGSVTVRGMMELSCVSLAARVDVGAAVRLTATEQALATNDHRLGRTSATRRPFTEAERNAAVALARQALQRQGVPASWLRRLVLRELTATDLNADGSVRHPPRVLRNVGLRRLQEAGRPLDQILRRWRRRLLGSSTAVP